MLTITKKDVLWNLSLLTGASTQQKRSMVCSMVGHSRIQSHCFGYYTCCRCDEQVGDALGSIYDEASKTVVPGHACETCAENYKALTWADKLMVPNKILTQLKEELKCRQS